MTVAQWPVNRDFLRNGSYSVTPANTVQTVQMESGRDKHFPTGNGQSYSITGQIRLTSAEKTTFEQWFINTLSSGAKPFLFSFYIYNGTPVTCYTYFTQNPPYQFTYRETNDWLLTLDLVAYPVADVASPASSATPSVLSRDVNSEGFSLSVQSATNLELLSGRPFALASGVRGVSEVTFTVDVPYSEMQEFVAWFWYTIVRGSRQFVHQLPLETNTSRTVYSMLKADPPISWVPLGHDHWRVTMAVQTEPTENIPSNLSRHNITPISFEVRWPALLNISGYDFQVSVNDQFSSTLISKTITQNLADDQSEIVPSLTPATTYYVRIRAKYTTGPGVGAQTINSLWSPEFAVTTSVVPIVTGLQITAKSTTTVSLSWNTPVPYSSALQLQYSIDPNFSTFATAPPVGNSGSVSSLLPGTVYYFRIVNFLNNIPSMPSRVARVQTDFSTPTSLLFSAVLSTSFRVHWFSGGAAAPSYFIQIDDDPAFGSPINLETSALSLLVTSLNPDTLYYVRVRAGTESVVWSNFSPRVSQITYPAPVSNLNAIFTEPDIVSLSWSHTGPTPLSFDVQRADNQAFTSNLISTTSTSTSETFSGLNRGARYYFRVRALGGAGYGTFSNIVPILLPVTAPSNLIASNVLETSMTLSWDSVPEALSYQLEYSTTSDFSSNVTPVNVVGTSHSVTGLTNDVLYYFRVTAVGINTNSSLFATVNQRTLASLEVPQSILVVNRAANAFSLTWDAVLTATSYRVYYSTSSSLPLTTYITTTSPSATIDMLTENTLYFFQVVAQNSLQTSALSPISPVLTILPRPVAPVAPIFTSRTVRYISFSWIPVARATSYIVYVSTSSNFTGQTSYTTTSTTFTTPKLSTGTTYYFRIVAQNSSGLSPFSPVISRATLAALAKPVPVVSALLTNGFTLSWPSVLGAEDYDVIVSQSTTMLPGTSSKITGTSRIITGLSDGTLYYVWVRANEETLSTISDRLEVTTRFVLAVLDAPVVSNIQDTGFTVSWTSEPTADSYTIEIDTSSSFNTAGKITLNEISNTRQVTGLQDDTLYYVRVAQVRSGQISDFSAETFARTLLTLSPITGFTLSALSPVRIRVTLNLSADISAIADQIIVQVYQNATFTGAGRSRSTTVASSLDFDGVFSGVTHYVRVAYSVGNRQSLWSPTKTIDLPSLGLTAPQNFTATAQSSESIETTWSAVSDATSYLVERSTSAQFPAGSTVSVTHTDLTDLRLTTTGLSPGTLYYFQIRAQATSSTPGPPSTAQATTIAAAPTNLVVTSNLGPTTILDWTPPASYSEHRITRLANEVTTLPVNAAITKTITGLTVIDRTLYAAVQGNSYTVFVQAATSPQAQASTPARLFYQASRTTIFGPPTNFRLVNVVQNPNYRAVTLQWDDVPNAASYIIEDSPSATFSSSLYTHQSVLAPITTVTLTNVLSSGTYYFRIMARQTDGTLSDPARGLIPVVIS